MKILVLNASALHLGYVGCYGNEWVATPGLDRLAAQGIVFDGHYADCPGGPRTCWTGRYHFPTPEPAAAPAPSPDLPALLQGHGIPFTLVHEPADTAVEEGTPLERTLEAALQTLEKQDRAGRWLVWVDLPTLLPPWEPPEEFLVHYFADEEEELEDEDIELEPLTPLSEPPTGPIDVEDITLLERLQRTYAAAVTYLDRGVALLVEELERGGLLNGVTVVFTADRGLALGEHGFVGAGRPWLHDEVVHLPLLFRLPDQAEAGRRVAALTQPVDLLPTLCELLGVPAPACHGHSLLPLARGERAEVRACACAGLEADGTLEWALRTPEWGFLLPLRTPPEDPTRGPQLYVKPDDRWEVNNVLHHHLEFAEGLEKTLRGFVAATLGAGPLREEGEGIGSRE